MSSVSSVAITPSSDNFTRLWNVSDLAHPVLLRKLSHLTNYPIAPAFAPNGKLLAV